MFSNIFSKKSIFSRKNYEIVSLFILAPFYVLFLIAIYLGWITLTEDVFARTMALASLPLILISLYFFSYKKILPQRMGDCVQALVWILITAAGNTYWGGPIRIDGPLFPGFILVILLFTLLLDTFIPYFIAGVTGGLLIVEVLLKTPEPSFLLIMEYLEKVMILLFTAFVSSALIRRIFSEQKITQKLRRAYRKIGALFEIRDVLLASIGDGVFAINRAKNIIYFNRGAEKLSGFKSSEIIGRTYYIFLNFIRERDGKRNIAFIQVALEGEIVPMTDPTLLVKKDGRKLPIESTAAPLRDKKGKVIGSIVVFRDASKERKLQQIQSEFSSLVSHELRSPLTVIGGYLEMLTEEPDHLTKKKRKMADIARDASNRLLNLIKELLKISHLEKGDSRTEPIIVNPLDLAERAVTEEIRQLFKQKRQKFVFKRPKSLPQIKASPEFIIIPIQNLLSNASKYTPKGGQIGFRIYQSFYGIIFRVTDSGMGIPQEEQSRVFQRFFRASNTTHLEKGTGLGLYMAKLMIELSGGRIWFKSQENEGTTFFINLPIFEQ